MLFPLAEQDASGGACCIAVVLAVAVSLLLSIVASVALEWLGGSFKGRTFVSALQESKWTVRAWLPLAPAL